MWEKVRVICQLVHVKPIFFAVGQTASYKGLKKKRSSEVRIFAPSKHQSADSYRRMNIFKIISIFHFIGIQILKFRSNKVLTPNSTQLTALSCSLYSLNDYCYHLRCIKERYISFKKNFIPRTKISI